MVLDEDLEVLSWETTMRFSMTKAEVDFLIGEIEHSAETNKSLADSYVGSMVWSSAYDFHIEESKKLKSLARKIWNQVRKK